MNTLLTAKNCFLFLSFLLLSSAVVHGQSVPLPNPQSPNVTSLGTFGDIPVDMATGVPNISVPIHTVRCGHINVPITLRYHPANVKMATHPSWVGTGWDLESGGVITRTVKWLPDEFYGGPKIMGAGAAQYYPEPVSNPPTSGAQTIYNNNNWATQSSLDAYFSGSGTLTDVCADEFTFNVMGHSGKFYYTPSGWQVVSDENILVQVNQTPLLTSQQVVNTVSNEFVNFPTRWFPNTNLGSSYDVEDATYVFTGFVLTMPDGTKYYFGGVDGNQHGVGIEFYTAYPFPGFALQFNTNAWLLTKVVDVDGNEVDFSYSASYATTELAFGYNADSWSCQGLSRLQNWPLGNGTNSSSGWTYTTSVDIFRHGGMLNIPLYLDKISCPNETVTFNRAEATCLRFTDDFYKEMDLALGNQQTNLFNLAVLGEGVVSGGQEVQYAQNLQWMELSAIAITDGNGHAGKSFNFNYNNSTSQRLALTDLTELDNTGISIEKYHFSYNNIGNLPLYDGNYSDHWGFFNGVNVTSATDPQSTTDQVTGSIFYVKGTDPNQVTTGQLTQITYPTGGYTKLTWQPHDYSQVVTSTSTLSRSTLSPPAPGIDAGCCRIYEVKSFLADGTPAHDKKYLYVRGYSNNNPSGHYSSGILDGMPTYSMQLQNRTAVDGTTIESINITQLNSMAVYSYNSEGSYIGYDQVVELNEDNSYTIHYLTSYGPDLNGVSHWDVQPLTAIGWIPTDNYYSVSDLSVERGKPIGSYKYNANDVLVQSSVNTYRNDATRFNNYVRFVNFNGSYSGCAPYGALVLATANQKFIYDYYVTSTTASTYDQNGKNPITSTTSYQYNSNNLVSSKTETDSKGEAIGTTYKYPPDMSDPTSVAMTNAHILSPVVQTIVTNNSVPIDMKQVNYYSTSTGLFKPQAIIEQIGTNAQETRQQFYTYDNYGNINEYSKANDIHTVYLWGYYGQFPIAKIEGATFSQVNALFQNGVQGAITNITNVIETPGTNQIQSGLETMFQTLRNGLPNALVTGYTYLPLAGVMSITDPKGLTNNYSYDNFQRLQMITDNYNNVLKTFSYQYQVPQ